MEPKQIAMLALLLTVATVGSSILIYVLQTLDKKENGDSDKDSHGHGGH